MRIRATLVARAAAVILIACSASSAYARGGSTACYSDSIPFTSPHFNLTLMLPRFDPADAFGNGTNIAANLTSVSLVLNGEAVGNVSLSNPNATSTNVVGSLNPAIVLQRPDTTALLTAAMNASFGPVLVNSLDIVQVGPLTAAKIESATLSSPSDLALFTGAGSLVLPIVGAASFFAAGDAGNVQSSASTMLSARADVCYRFGIAPEPGALTLLLCGVMALISRRHAEAIK